MRVRCKKSLAKLNSLGYVKLATRFGCSAMAGVSTGNISNRTWLHSGSSSSPSIVCTSTSTCRRFPCGGESVGPQRLLQLTWLGLSLVRNLSQYGSAPSRLLECCLLTPPGWNFLGIAEHTQFLMFLPWGNITPTIFLVEYSLRHRLWLTWTVINGIMSTRCWIVASVVEKLNILWNGLGIVNPHGNQKLTCVMKKEDINFPCRNSYNSREQLLNFNWQPESYFLVHETFTGGG